MSLVNGAPTITRGHSVILPRTGFYRSVPILGKAFEAFYNFLSEATNEVSINSYGQKSSYL